jgi:hypothetical protein
MTNAVFDLVQPQRLTAALDIGANPIDGEPSYMLGRPGTQGRYLNLVGSQTSSDHRERIDREMHSITPRSVRGSG